MLKGTTIFRLACIATLWLLLCVWYVDRLIRTQQEITLLALFPLLASGIIVGVPLYKKYFKKRNDSD